MKNSLIKNKKMAIACDKYAFDEESHTHTINGREVTGTTTIVGIIDKPALMHWAVKISFNVLLKTLKKSFKSLITLDKKAFTLALEEAIAEAKKEPIKKRDEAGSFGTVVHAMCEHFNLTGELLEPRDPKLGEKALKCGEQFTNKQLVKATTLVTQYLDWLNVTDSKIVYVEQNVFSESLHTGGIFDMVIEYESKLYIADFKTSSGVYPSQFVQMGGYQLQLEEMAKRDYITELDIAGYIVIHLPRKGKIAVHIKEEVAVYRRAFRACVYIYRVINDQLWAIKD